MRKKTDSLQKKIASFMLGMHYLTGTNSCIQLALIGAMATIRAIYGIAKIYKMANSEYYLLITDLTDIYIYIDMFAKILLLMKIKMFHFSDG
jgi:hypothetical protein